MGDGIKVKASTLGEKIAGRGAFVDRPVVRGALITEYAGCRVWHREDVCLLRAQTHVISLRPFGLDYFIDGLRDPVLGRGAGSFINRPNQAEHCNATFDCVDGFVFARALRDIASGEEIFVNYGKGSTIGTSHMEPFVNVDGKTSFRVIHHESGCSGGVGTQSLTRVHAGGGGKAPASERTGAASYSSQSFPTLSSIGWKPRSGP